jgi:hypothetical protein
MNESKEASGEDKQPFRDRRVEIVGPDFSANALGEFIAREYNAIPERFSNAIEDVERIETAFKGGKATFDEIQFASKFGEDLYQAYVISSGHLSNTIGADLLLRAFRAVAPIWPSIVFRSEYVAFSKLPDVLTVYRGAIGPVKDAQKGISWTVRKETAATFLDAPGSILIQASVSKEDVLVFLEESAECIIDPEKLTSVSLVESTS